jgi:hypothetical protein
MTAITHVRVIDGSGTPGKDEQTVLIQDGRIRAVGNTAAVSFAIQTAHARGLRITGHLCAVGFGEAAEMGIDNLEHGLAVDRSSTRTSSLTNVPTRGVRS